MLNESIIQQKLNSADFHTPLKIHILESVDSTNQFLKDLPASNTIEICCAEEQTMGRGRFGRTWYSPAGENIYFSFRWHFNGELSQLSGLSLVVSLAIIAMLTELNINDDIRVKWPNDLLWKNKKLCGILIEITRNNEVVIGIGLNVNSTMNALAQLSRPSCSLYEITGTHLDRNTLITKLIIWLNQYLQQFITQGLSSFMPLWQKTDYLYGQLITVSQPTGMLRGIAKGINEAGHLILIDELGVMHYLSSGDTSLRVV